MSDEKKQPEELTYFLDHPQISREESFGNGSKPSFDLKKEHKSDKGGLTEKGRKAYNKATGSNLKPPQPEGGPRRDSYCARSKGQMNDHNIDCSKTPDKRICKARKRWKC
jgi:hypothetical protein